MFWIIIVSWILKTLSQLKCWREGMKVSPSLSPSLIHHFLLFSFLPLSSPLYLQLTFLPASLPPFFPSFFPISLSSNQFCFISPLHSSLPLFLHSSAAIELKEGQVHHLKKILVWKSEGNVDHICFKLLFITINDSWIFWKNLWNLWYLPGLKVHDCTKLGFNIKLGC